MASRRSTRSTTRAKAAQQQHLIASGVIAQIAASKGKKRLKTSQEFAEGLSGSSRKRCKGYVYSDEIDTADDDQENISIFERLPIEVFQLILLHMDGKTLRSLFATSRGVAVLLTGMWKELYRAINLHEAVYTELCPHGHVHDSNKQGLIYSPAITSSRSQKLVDYEAYKQDGPFTMEYLSSRVYDWRTQLILSLSYARDALDVCTMCGAERLQPTSCPMFGVRLCKACVFRHLIPKSMLHAWGFTAGQLSLPTMVLTPAGRYTTRKDALYYFSRHLWSLQRQLYPNSEVLKNKQADFLLDLEEAREERETKDSIIENLLSEYGYNNFKDLQEFLKAHASTIANELLGAVAEFYNGKAIRPTRGGGGNGGGNRRRSSQQSDTKSNGNRNNYNSTNNNNKNGGDEVAYEKVRTSLNKVKCRRARFLAVQNGFESLGMTITEIEKSKKARDSISGFVAGQLHISTFDSLGDVTRDKWAEKVVEDAIRDYEKYKGTIIARDKAIDAQIPAKVDLTNFHYMYGLTKDAWIISFRSYLNRMSTRGYSNNNDESDYPAERVNFTTTNLKRSISVSELNRRRTRLHEEMKRKCSNVESFITQLQNYFEEWKMSMQNNSIVPEKPMNIPSQLVDDYITALYPNLAHRMDDFDCNVHDRHFNVCLGRTAGQIVDGLPKPGTEVFALKFKQVTGEQFCGVQSLQSRSAKDLYTSISKSVNLQDESAAAIEVDTIWRMERVHRELQNKLPYFDQANCLSTRAYKKYLELVENCEEIEGKVEEIVNMQKVREKRIEIAASFASKSGLGENEEHLKNLHRRNFSNGGYDEMTMGAKDWIENQRSVDVIGILDSWVESEFNVEILTKALVEHVNRQERDKRRSKLAKRIEDDELFIKHFYTSYAYYRYNGRSQCFEWKVTNNVVEQLGELSYVYRKYVHELSKEINEEDVVTDLRGILDRLVDERIHRVDFVKNVAQVWSDLIFTG